MALAATLSIASGCRKENAGDVVTRDIPVERTYSSVEVNSAVEVTYSGTAETMSVKAQAALRDSGFQALPQHVSWMSLELPR